MYWRPSSFSFGSVEATMPTLHPIPMSTPNFPKFNGMAARADLTWDYDPHRRGASRCPPRKPQRSRRPVTAPSPLRRGGPYSKARASASRLCAPGAGPQRWAGSGNRCAARRASIWPRSARHHGRPAMRRRRPAVNESRPQPSRRELGDRKTVIHLAMIGVMLRRLTRSNLCR